MNWSPEAIFKTSVGAALIVLLAAVGFGWSSAMKLNQVLNKMESFDRAIQAISQDQWTYTDQKLWAYEIREKGIAVPMPAIPAKRTQP